MRSGAYGRFEVSLSHSVLNSLYSGYQGKFTAQNMLKQLGFAKTDETGLASSREVLDLIGLWLKRLFDGEALLTTADQPPISEDAPKIWQLFLGLKHELGALAKELTVFRRLPSSAHETEAAKYLVASLGRVAYSREHYIKGLVRYASAFGPPEELERWKQQATACRPGIRRVHRLFDAMGDAKATDLRLFENIRQLSLPMPGALRCLVHDMNVLLGMARGGMTYEIAGIGQDDALSWDNLEVEPQVAGYWHAYELPPDHAVAWVERGFTDPEVAGSWAVWEFTAATASAWLEAEFHPRAARDWKNHGFESSVEAAEWRDSGFPVAKMAAGWKECGFELDDAVSWRAANYRPSEAQEWRERGAKNPLLARKQAKTMNALSSPGLPTEDPHNSNLGGVSSLGAGLFDTVDVRTPAELDTAQLIGAFLGGQVPTRRPLGGMTPETGPDTGPLALSSADLIPLPESRFHSCEAFVREVTGLIVRGDLGSVTNAVRDGAMLVEPTSLAPLDGLLDRVKRAPTEGMRASQVRATFYFIEALRDSPHASEDAVHEVACRLLGGLSSALGTLLPMTVRVQLACRLSRVLVWRHRGDRAQNVEHALRALRGVSDSVGADGPAPRTPGSNDSRLLWAQVQHHTGFALTYRAGGKGVSRAIETLRSALGVYAPSTRPLDWALAQIDLGDAMRRRREGDRSQHIEDALGCYENALSTLNAQTNPIHRALAMQRFGVAYLERRVGGTTFHAMTGVERLNEALQSLAKDGLDAAYAHLALARHHHKRTTRSKRPKDLERAVQHYELAKGVFRRDTFPKEYREAEDGLAMARRDAQEPSSERVPT